MIVKFYNQDKCYMVDEITNLHHHYLNEGERPLLREYDWDLTGSNLMEEEPVKTLKNRRRIYLGLDKKGDCDLIIITYTPIYVMNNEGKTIETIN